MGVDVEVEYPWKPGQSDSSQSTRISKIQSKMPPKSKPAGRLSPSAPVVNGSRGKGSWRYASKSENLVKPAGPVPAPNSSKALQSSEADIPPDPVDGIVANVGNIISEDNDLGWKHPRHISSNPVTTGKADRATPDSNSFAALLNPEADTMHTLAVDSSKSEVNPSVELAPGSNLSEWVLEPLGELPLVVYSSSSIQFLPACNPQLSKDVQLVEEPPGPSSSCISSHSRSSRSARRVLVEAAQALENKDVGPPLTNRVSKQPKGAKKKIPPSSILHD
ncbi:hypothetical protein Nepgr_018770 [Nepenthes gracilis]|uniref:Uncharacterized protein n=1 Tax=Nepenthes gracilis TaxID=150966 RepID=A0AAD3SU00_NEPGR|nr:hypothetical protein Nepgr_018770 [Nepenthes gracilis]